MNAVALLGIVAAVGCGLMVVLAGRGIGPVSACRQQAPAPRSECPTGAGLINNPLMFRTAADLDTVAAKLMTDIAPGGHDAPVAELHLALAEPTGDGASFVLLFCTGGGASKVMETAVLLKPCAGGTSGSVGMEAWRTVDGDIDSVAVRTARTVRDGVRKVVAQLDSAAEFTELT